MTFVERCIAGLAAPADIDNEIDRWHDGQADTPLHTYLGFTWDEWCLFLVASIHWASDVTHGIVDKIIQARTLAGEEGGDEI